MKIFLFTILKYTTILYILLKNLLKIYILGLCKIKKINIVLNQLNSAYIKRFCHYIKGRKDKNGSVSYLSHASLLFSLSSIRVFKCTSTSLFTDSTFYQNVNNFHEYLTQHSLKSGGTKDHFIERPALSLSFPQAHIDIYSMYQDTRFYGHKILYSYSKNIQSKRDIQLWHSYWTLDID